MKSEQILFCGDNCGPSFAAYTQLGLGGINRVFAYGIKGSGSKILAMDRIIGSHAGAKSMAQIYAECGWYEAMAHMLFNFPSPEKIKQKDIEDYGSIVGTCKYVVSAELKEEIKIQKKQGDKRYGDYQKSIDSSLCRNAIADQETCEGTQIVDGACRFVAGSAFIGNYKGIPASGTARYYNVASIERAISRHMFRGHYYTMVQHCKIFKLDSFFF